MFLGEILRFTQRFALMFLQTSLPEIWSDSTGFGHQVEGELLGGFSGKAWCWVPFLPFSARSLGTQPNVETKTAHYILNSETGSCPPVIFLVGWKKCSWAKDGKIGWCRVGCQAYVSKLMKHSTSTRCGDFEMSTTKNWCIYIYRCDMYIYTYYVQFRYTPKSCRPPSLPISETFDSTYDGSDRP